MEGMLDPTINSSAQSNEGGGVNSGKASDETRQEGNGDVTLEAEVKQLVGSVSSWWSDFSKKSQDQINAARKELESQGGILSIAKREAQKFEAQLNEAQKAARERAQADLGDKGDTGGTAQPLANTDKGKQREVAQGDDGVAVEELERKARTKSRSDSRSEPMITSTGESIFDVDGDVTAEEQATIEAARQNAQSALHNVQNIWDRLQADPRMNSIQASIAKTLHNVSVPKMAASKDAPSGADGESGSTKSSTISFADVSKQFQASFPHLNWKESQALAKKYYDASENVARDWGKEMSTLMSDLVKIVPPEEQEQQTPGPKATPTPEKPLSRAQKPSGTTTTTTEEEDFDWDADMDAQSASTGVRIASGQSTTDENPSKSPLTSSAAGSAPKTKDDEGDDSDWD